MIHSVRPFPLVWFEWIIGLDWIGLVVGWWYEVVWLDWLTTPSFLICWAAGMPDDGLFLLTRVRVRVLWRPLCWCLVDWHRSIDNNSVTGLEFDERSNLISTLALALFLSPQFFIDYYGCRERRHYVRLKQIQGFDFFYKSSNNWTKSINLKHNPLTQRPTSISFTNYHYAWYILPHIEQSTLNTYYKPLKKEQSQPIFTSNMLPIEDMWFDTETPAWTGYNPSMHARWQGT